MLTIHQPGDARGLERSRRVVSAAKQPMVTSVDRLTRPERSVSVSCLESEHAAWTIKCTCSKRVNKPKLEKRIRE
jgi:hypothetical protein